MLSQTYDIGKDFSTTIRKLIKYLEPTGKEEEEEEYKWSIQWDDRLSCFFIFLFPTPVIGILLEDRKAKIFPVGGNSFLQKKAIELITTNLNLGN